MPKKLGVKAVQDGGVSGKARVIRVPLRKVLPSFLPATLVDRVGEYENGSIDLQNEKRLNSTEVRVLLITASYLGAEEAVLRNDFDLAKSRAILSQSLHEINEITPAEIDLAMRLVGCFHSFPIIRADHALDDWITEALWNEFQNTPYFYPSAMSGVIANALFIRYLLKKIYLSME